MLEKGTFLLNEEEEYIEEGFLGFGKKKSRWQRFKDAIGRNKGKIAGGLAALGMAYRGYKFGQKKGEFDNVKQHGEWDIISYKNQDGKSVAPTSIYPDGRKTTWARNTKTGEIKELDVLKEGFLGFGKKKSRWQRFKDAMGRNSKKLAAGIVGTGLATYGTYKLGHHKSMQQEIDPVVKANYRVDKETGKQLWAPEVIDKRKGTFLTHLTTRPDGKLEVRGHDVDEKDHPIYKNSPTARAELAARNFAKMVTVGLDDYTSKFKKQSSWSDLLKMHDVK